MVLGGAVATEGGTKTVGSGENAETWCFSSDSNDNGSITYVKIKCT